MHNHTIYNRTAIAVWNMFILGLDSYSNIGVSLLQRVG